ncbi:MAG TPA: FtsX-like permease family protein [Streptosporangiaceae bacterium]
MRSNGLARASVRFRPASFAGTFLALLFASIVVTACGLLLQAGVTASLGPVRYAGVPVVVTADQNATVVRGHGEDTERESEPLPDAARVDASLARTIAARPGVAAAVPDLAFPVQAAVPEQAAFRPQAAFPPRAAASLPGRNWSGARITSRLVQGGGPAAGQVVVEAATARAARLRVGDAIALTTPRGTRTYRVAGIAAGGGPGIWFSDAEAAALSGHQGQADAIAVFARSGVGVEQLESQVRAAVGGGAKIYTGAGRGTAEHRDLADARDLLTGLGGSFGGIATMVAVFVVLGTVALAIGQRAREIALLRAVGATPRQIRRMVATEAMIVAPIAGGVGVLPGTALATWWFDQLKHRGALPSGLHLTVGWVPPLCAVGAGLLAALAGGWAAARRPAKARPSQALGEAAVERTRPGIARTILGVGALAGALVVAQVAAGASGDQAAEAALGVVMLFMVAVAFLGPLVAAGASVLLGLPMRTAGAPGRLAAANTRVNARRLASAVTPIVLVVTFAGTLLFTQSTMRHAAAAEARDGVVADQVVSSAGPGIPYDTARRAAAVPGVRAAIGVVRTGVLYHGSDVFSDASAIGVSGDPAALPTVLDLGVVRGEVAALRPGTVALDSMVAAAAHVTVGRPIELRLGDGAKIRATVVATYRRGLGVGQVLLPHETVAGHVSAELDGQILIHDAPGADGGAVRRALSGLAPSLVVTDRRGYAAQIDRDAEVNAWVNNVMVAVLGGFAAIAAANTLVMTVLDRRREVALLRLAGTTRRQVLSMMRWEALLVTTAGLLLGAAILAVTLSPFARGTTGGAPYVPPVTALVMGVAIVAGGLAVTALPARALLRTPPATAAAARE